MADAAADLKATIAKKDALEREILELQRECDAIGPVIDAQGFPRADIDVAAERTKRNQLAMMKTDHTALMRDIEAKLFALHDAYRAEDEARRAQQGSSQQNEHNMHHVDDEEAKQAEFARVLTSPMCKVAEVVEGSPAFVAGFLVGDEVMRCADLDASNNPYGLPKIGDVIRRRVKQEISVVVRRRVATTTDQQYRFRELRFIVPDGPLGVRLV
jgi:26S proteasome non-ATPase regulatory subunit 9